MAPIQNHAVIEGVMASLSIKNVPNETLRRLHTRAERNHRSLQQELLSIVESAASAVTELNVDELALYVSDMQLSTSDDLTTWIRDLRDGY